LDGVWGTRNHGGILETQCVSECAMIEQLFKNEVVRRRMAANHLGIILTPFALDLHDRGYALSGIRHHVLVTEHFGQWLQHQHGSLRRLSTLHVQHFLRYHLPRCRCADPASKRRLPCQAALGRLVEFLRGRKRIQEFEKRTPPPGPVDQILATYDRHLNQVCGLSADTRRRRRLLARRFLQWRFGRKPPRLRQLHSKDVAAFVLRRARQLSPSGVRDLAVSLRSFLHFLEFSGSVRPGLAGSVPQPVKPLPPPPTKILERQQWRKFLNSFPRSNSLGRRDYAIALCLSELALRGAEVVGLTLDDLDWRAMTLRVAQNKQRRQHLLPLPESVAKAILNYLEGGRPPTRSRTLFVHHVAPVGQALTAQLVRKRVRQAFARCGIEASGTHILRHTWATWAHRRGVGLKLIADMLGHRSLGATMRYAHVHVEELRQVALPWPTIQR
jgi:site-specific recombinase XerD